MVVRGEGTSRGKKFSVRLISIRLDISRVPPHLRSRPWPQVLVDRGGRGPRTLPRRGTRRRMACGMAACIGRAKPAPHAPSTREVPFDLTFDQWEGNSEILRARCAEKGGYDYTPTLPQRHLRRRMGIRRPLSVLAPGGRRSEGP